MKGKKQKKPSPIHLEDGIVLRCIRGPNEEGEFYWTVKYKKADGKEGTYFSQWGNPGTVIPEFYRRKGLGLLEKAEEGPPKQLKDLLDLWLAKVESDPKVKSTSEAKYRRSVRRLKEYLGDCKLEALTVPTLESWKIARLKEISDNTFNLEHQVLHACWHWATLHGYTPFHKLNVQRVTKPKEVEEKYTPSDSEVDAIWSKLDCEAWKKVALTVCRYTGARNGELDDLRWEAIDFQRETITLTGKTGTRTLPIFPELKACLLAWQETPIAKSSHQGQNEDQNIFGRSHWTVRRYLNPTLHQATDAAGIEHRITIHSLRRWFISRLKRAGVDVKTAASWMGHSPQVMLTIYSSTTEEDLKQAMSKVISLG